MSTCGKTRKLNGARREQGEPVEINFFLLFTMIFLIFFLEQGSQKIEPQEISRSTEVGYGLQKIGTFSEKRART